MKKLVLALTLCAGVISCTNLTSNSDSAATPQSSTSLVSLGTISTIPLPTIEVNGNPEVGPANTYVTVLNNSDHVVHLQKVTAHGDASVVQNPNLYVNTSACSVIPAAGSCNVILQTPNHDGGFILTLDFDQNSTSQQINYQANLPFVNNLAFSNNFTVLKNGNQRSAFSIPVQVGADFKQLSLSTSQPNLIQAGSSCAGRSPKAGEICTISGTVAATAPDGLIDLKLSGQLATNGRWVVSPLAVLNRNDQPNLVTTVSNLIINSADGSYFESVTLLNNGTQAINGSLSSSISNITDNSINLSNLNKCSNLAVGQPCTFNVNVTGSATQNEVALINLTYQGPSGTSYSLMFNVTELIPNGVVNALVTSSGNLNNIGPGESGSFAIKLLNTGKAKLNNIHFVDVATINADLAYTSGSGNCSLTGSQNLGSGESCTLNINFTPQKTETGTINFSFFANYAVASGESYTFSVPPVVIPFSSYTNQANLIPSNVPVAFNIAANGSESQESQVTLTNQGAYPTTIQNIQVPGRIVTLNKTNACIPGTTVLASNQSCTLYLKYGPFINDESANGAVKISYLPTATSAVTTASFNVSYQASTTSLVALTGIKAKLTGTGTLTGDGISVNSAYTYTNDFNNQLKVTLTYTNVGLSNANNLNIMLESNLPAWLQVDQQSGCGYGGTTSTLAIGQSCDIVLRAVNNNYPRPLNLFGQQSFALPGFSYTDTGSGVNKVAASNLTGYNGQVFINFNPLISSLSGSARITAQSTESNANLVFSAAAGAPAQDFPATIYINGLQSTGAISARSGVSCNVSTNTAFSSCLINITIAPWAPAGTYYYQGILIPSNGNFNNGYSFPVSIIIQ